MEFYKFANKSFVGQSSIVWLWECSWAKLCGTTIHFWLFSRHMILDNLFKFFIVVITLIIMNSKIELMQI